MPIGAAGRSVSGVNLGRLVAAVIIIEQYRLTILFRIAWQPGSRPAGGLRRVVQGGVVDGL